VINWLSFRLIDDIDHRAVAMRKCGRSSRVLNGIPAGSVKNSDVNIAGLLRGSAGSPGDHLRPMHAWICGAACAASPSARLVFSNKRSLARKGVTAASCDAAVLHGEEDGEVFHVGESRLL
jgi:hypothetical protein